MGEKYKAKLERKVTANRRGCPDKSSRSFRGGDVEFEGSLSFAGAA